MKKILLGTTNASKITRFKELLDGYDVSFYTLSDLQISGEPDEQGTTPAENAKIKAKYYSRYFDAVICNDSGLYFEDLSLDDNRQPGLNVRTPNGGKRLNDDEMIAYYSALVRSLGGKVLAYYLDGFAVYNKGEIHTFMENNETTRLSAFWMVDTPSPKRQPGWPLNSLSKNRNTLTYFSEAGNNKYDTPKEQIMLGAYRKRLIQFLVNALNL